MCSLNLEDELFVAIYSVFINRILQIWSNLSLVITFATLWLLFSAKRVPFGKQWLVVDFSEADSCLFVAEVVCGLAVDRPFNLTP